MGKRIKDIPDFYTRLQSLERPIEVFDDGNGQPVDDLGAKVRFSLKDTDYDDPELVALRSELGYTKTNSKHGVNITDYVDNSNIDWEDVDRRIKARRMSLRTFADSIEMSYSSYRRRRDSGKFNREEISRIEKVLNVKPGKFQPKEEKK